MVAPAGVLLLLLRLAAFIFGPRLFVRSFVCLGFFSGVIGASTPASSLKMTHVQNKGEKVDKNL